jgi:hypothetical protein
MCLTTEVTEGKTQDHRACSGDYIYNKTINKKNTQELCYKQKNFSVYLCENLCVLCG